ncbi:MAG: hypothetical protein AAFY88_17705, partial [Acidobacteriota bacterium]
DRGAEIAMHENHPPEIRAARLDTVGRVYQRLGLYRQATPLLEKSLELTRPTVSRRAARISGG